MCEHEERGQSKKTELEVVENATAPFIIYALPRSRTFWLSKFLSVGDWHCYHEHAMHLRSIEDAKSFLSQDNTGTAETGVSPGWRLIQHFRPDIKQVVIRRPVADVVWSLLALDIGGVGYYDRTKLERTMIYMDRMLDQIAGQRGVLSVDFKDLVREDACAAIFEHCLPYEFDREWWNVTRANNLQVDSRALLRYRFAHRMQIDHFKALCWAELRRLTKIGAFDKGLAA